MRHYLGLHDDFVSRQRRQDVAELHFGRAVPAGRFKVIDAQFNRVANNRFKIFLVLAGNFVRINVLPLELVPHPAAGNDGHLEFRAAKASVFHAREV